MSNDLSVLFESGYTQIVEQMQNLLSQNRRAFLVGAGCSKCAGLPLMPELTKKITGYDSFSTRTRNILLAIQKLYDGSSTATIEDYMSELVDLLSIAERRTSRGATESIVQLGNETHNANQIAESLLEIKSAIARCIKLEPDTETHRRFVRVVHHSLQSGKACYSPVDYFILNYDTLIEDALGLERLLFVDGFNGGATGWWHQDTFNQGNVAARVFKLHGSIDWCLYDGDVFPRRVRPGIKASTPCEQVLIYPAATKHKETQRDPFAQILSFMRKTLRPPEKAETILAICGYAFGDSHINIEIERALHESEKQLNLLIFVSTDEPPELVQSWLAIPELGNQVRVHTNRGFFHGKEELKSDADLPWWKFEVLTRLLGGER